MHTQGFDAGSLVLLTLHTPRQKFIGILLRLSPAGIELRCIHLESLEDVARQLRSGEAVSPATIFFPMHRVERMELDEATGEMPSLAQGFAAQAGVALEVLLGGKASAAGTAEPES
jgi:hypothetical protein